MSFRRHNTVASSSSFANVTFRSRRNGEELACFERQTRRQVELLMAHPPTSLRFAAYEMVVTPFA
jgi:hypothetical protein